MKNLNPAEPVEQDGPANTNRQNEELNLEELEQVSGGTAASPVQQVSKRKKPKNQEEFLTVVLTDVLVSS